MVRKWEFVCRAEETGKGHLQRVAIFPNSAYLRFRYLFGTLETIRRDMASLQHHHLLLPGLVGEKEESSPASPSLSGLPGSRRALCVWLPTFELRLELARSPELDATSVALLAPGGGSRHTVWQVSERGAQAGVLPGQLVSQAISLCPALTILEPDPAHYDAAQEEMLEALMEMSPVVEPAGRGRIFVGTDGLERLHGHPSRYGGLALQALLGVFPRPLVAATRVGQASGKFGAWVVATRAGPGSPMTVPDPKLLSFLASCPVSVLPVEPLMIQRLERLGITTLKQLSELPEPALVGQFGVQGRRALEWATGRRRDPVRPLHRPRPIRASLDFPSPAGRTETLHGALDRLLDKALSRPARRGRGVRGVRLRADLEGGKSWSMEVVLREPTARKESIAFPLKARMALSPPPRAVERLVLEIFRFGPAASQPGFFDRKEEGGRDAGRTEMAEGTVPPSLREAVKELKLKLGHSPLYRVVEVDPWSRIPERRHALMSFEP
jgi:protein ImuB